MYLTVDREDGWKERSDDRKEKKIGSFVATLPKDYVFPRPVFCPCCSRPMRDAQDIAAFDTNGCCFFCDNRFARPNLEKWKSGWRPSSEDVVRLIHELGLDVPPKNIIDR